MDHPRPGALPSFAYAAHRDPLDAHTLQALAVGVSTRAYRHTLDPLPAGRTAHAVAKSSVSRRFVALTKARLTTWLAQPGAAASLREGLAETLTLQRLSVTGALYRTLRNTNAIENLNGLVGHFVRNVRRWRDGAMLVRWIATGLQDAQRRFRRIRGCADMPALVRALDRHQVDTKKTVA